MNQFLRVKMEFWGKKRRLALAVNNLVLVLGFHVSVKGDHKGWAEIFL